MRATPPQMRAPTRVGPRHAPPPAASPRDDASTRPVLPAIVFVAGAGAAAAIATAALPSLDALEGDGITSGLGVAAGGAPADALAAALWAAALRLASPYQLLLVSLGRSEGDAPADRARAALESAGVPPPVAAAAELAAAAAAGTALALTFRSSLGDGIWGVASGLAALTTAAGAALGRPPPPPPPDVAAALEARAAAFQRWADGGGLARRGGCHESEVVAAWAAAARRYGVVDPGDGADVALLVRAWGGRGVSRTPRGFFKGVSVTDRGLALPVTSLYVGLLGAGLVALTVRVIKTRRANKVPWGDGGITELKRVVRAHANFTEFVPLAAIQLALLEASGRAPSPALHALGAGLTVARAANAAALIGIAPSRVPGTAGTIALLATMSTWLVAQGLGLC